MLILPALLLLQTPVPAQPPTPTPRPTAMAVPAAEPAAPMAPARIAMTTPFPVHLGSVGPRESREAVFGIRSLHDRPFRLRVLDLSLGLTAAEEQFAEALQPKEVRLIRVKVDASGLTGFVKGALRLGTDDPAQPTYILRYDMTVRPEVSVDAVRHSFGEVAPHERPEVVFHFKREGGDPLKLVLASVGVPHLETDIVDQGTTSDLRLKLQPGRLKPGVSAGLDLIKVATNGPREPLFELYVDWRLVWPVVAKPARVVFADPKTTMEALELVARDGQPFRILRLAIEGQGFELLDSPTLPAKRHVLRIRRTGNQADALLVVHCSNLEEPLRVPLRFLDPRARPKEVSPLRLETEDHHH